MKRSHIVRSERDFDAFVKRVSLHLGHLIIVEFAPSAGPPFEGGVAAAAAPEVMGMAEAVNLVLSVPLVDHSQEKQSSMVAFTSVPVLEVCVWDQVGAVE